MADALLHSNCAYGLGRWFAGSFYGALDFAGGTVVHINAAIAGLVGAYLIGKRVGFGKEAFKPHNLPMVFTGTAILDSVGLALTPGQRARRMKSRHWHL